MSVANFHENGHDGITQPSSTSSRLLRQRPLTSRQERKLVDYLDESILELTRNFKKRSEETSTLKTLSAYIEAVRRLLALILQIPPLDPSTGLRIAYLLRLTGDVLNSIPGYTLGMDKTIIQQTLQDLVDFLDDLDQAWLSVLQGQVWDPERGEGIDLIVPVEEAINLNFNLPSQTDLTRLRSLLFTGQSALEEWLSGERSQRDAQAAQMEDLGDVSGMLSRMGLLHEFDSLFSRTLDFLGGFGENISRNILDPQEEGLME